jgi:lipoate-protein ligase A
MKLCVLPYRVSSAVCNMALDSTMLEETRDCAVLFRAYGWSETAYTFGYTQRLQDVLSQIGPHAGSLVRRPTGGGIVDHTADWTYSIATQSSVSLSKEKPLEMIRRVHEMLVGSLRELGAAVDCYSPDSSHFIYPKACFERPSPWDVIDMSGKKIAGLALKRTRCGILMQGSVSRASLPDLNFDLLDRSFSDRLAESLELQTFSASADSLYRDAFERFRVRYLSEDWNCKR